MGQNILVLELGGLDLDLDRLEWSQVCQHFNNFPLNTLSWNGQLGALEIQPILESMGVTTNGSQIRGDSLLSASKTMTSRRNCSSEQICKGDPV